jgi:hypothetical protein
MQKDHYPTMWDFSFQPLKTEQEAQFLRNQWDTEIAAGCYSQSFGTELLLGMYSTPIHSMPKPHSEKLWLINDHSAGPFSLNSMIAHEDIAGVRLDTIVDLMTAILWYWQTFGSKCLILFKSDVSAAYWRLPLHLLWQIKQITTVDGQRHVDHCTTFSGRGSPTVGDKTLQMFLTFSKIG